jgi:hypothetical protein
MQYPVNLRFKIAALASQIFVTDNNGSELFYVKQKLFKLKENIEIYHDSTKSQLIYRIKTDKVIDFSATYTLYDAMDRPLGTIKRNGARSILKANYDISINGQPFAHVQEGNPWTKLGDALFGELPIIGLFAGYMFHPRYIIKDTTDTEIAMLKKQPAFLEGKFILEATGLEKKDENTQKHAAILLMMVALLERLRS